jgi:predicted transcriptional regulator
MSELTEEQRKILNALYGMAEPGGCKVIGEAAEIPWRTVMARLRGLKKDGYVDSPVKSKYVITDKGKEAVS